MSLYQEAQSPHLFRAVHLMNELMLNINLARQNEEICEDERQAFINALPLDSWTGWLNAAEGGFSEVAEYHAQKPLMLNTRVRFLPNEHRDSAPRRSHTGSVIYRTTDDFYRVAWDEKSNPDTNYFNLETVFRRNQLAIIGW